jgi:hypothetical protein
MAPNENLKHKLKLKMKDKIEGSVVKGLTLYLAIPCLVFK